MDTWVQCSRCEKWRRVDPSVSIPTNVAWLCRYNLFDPAHNQCSHAQESFPEEEEEDVSFLDIVEDVNITDLLPSEDPHQPFQPSTCTCEHCLETNWAVKHWSAMRESNDARGLIQILMDAVDATEIMALTAEDNKQFLSGQTVDVHNPPVSRVPRRCLGGGASSSRQEG